MSKKYPAKIKRGHAPLEVAASRIRLKLGFSRTERLDGLRVFESLDGYHLNVENKQIGLSYAVEELAPEEEAEARYEPDHDEIAVILTPDTYASLEEDLARARFSLFHEIGHAVLHPSELMGLSAISRHQAALQRSRYSSLKPYEDCEWQANAFSAALAMPAAGLAELEAEGALEPQRIAAVFGSSVESAEYRLATFLKRRQTLLRVSN